MSVDFDTLVTEYAKLSPVDRMKLVNQARHLPNLDCKLCSKPARRLSMFFTADKRSIRTHTALCETCVKELSIPMPNRPTKR